MKKAVVGILTGVVLIAVSAASVLAAAPERQTSCRKEIVCAVSAASKCHRNYVDADGDGICDNRGTECGNAANYMDADGDGICDNRDAGCVGNGNNDGYAGHCGNGNGFGDGTGNGHGCHGGRNR